MSKLIEVKNISQIYRGREESVTALKEISFNLDTGDDLAIIGPSGSGKTTLLQIIGGLSRPSQGEVYINGENLFKGGDNKISDFRNKTIGFVFQNIYLQDYFTALENVMLPMLISGRNRKSAKNRAIELLNMVGLKDRANHRPNKLSGGEEQRVAIARALANNPKIIMADEPTAKLDKQNKENILKIFSDINKETGISIITITHDESFSNYFKKRIKLKHGTLEDKNF